MSVTVKPGSVITITVKASPSSQAAAKTLGRLLAKDMDVKQARRRRKAFIEAKIVTHQRGGRPWRVRPRAPMLREPVKGATCKVRATLDVINDLHSVERFVDVQVAG